MDGLVDTFSKRIEKSVMKHNLILKSKNSKNIGKLNTHQDDIKHANPLKIKKRQ